ncbi:MAG: YDG domain-containing protein [Gemmiger formicilis]|uniref:YDG domain-containing protein n=1 Tax=Gemmiger formicilis TaxID=745368 RepID=UPI002E7606FC|nr:YDG domain-containing protein [Gemmiger formicilis]MEE1513192.1 YDG domain-containing protein [Gemmiger formicilis]
MKKRVLSLFLAITLCLTLTPTGALAAEGQPPEQMVTATQEAETDAGENASPANPEENPTEDAPAAAEKNTADEETGKEAGQNEPTMEGKNELPALNNAGQDAAGGGIYVAPGSPTEGGGGTYISGEDTRTEIWCTSKPDSIGRSYDGTTDGGTIPIDLTFTDGTNEIKLKEGTGFTAKKTFDSADAGWHTVTVEIALIGEAAVKYKLKAGEETFTIGGNINKAYPKLTVSLSQTACTAGEKLLPLLSVEGAPEDAEVTYYYLASALKSWAGSSDVEGSDAMPKIDENTAISEPGTYYVYAKTGETKNYEEERSTTAELTVNEAVVEAASVTKKDGTDGGTYESLPAALNAAQNGDTVTLLSDVDLGETYVTISKSITFDLNGKTLSSSKTWSSDGVLLVKNATVTVKNGTVKATGIGSCAIRAYRSGASMTLEAVTATVTSNKSSVMVGDFGSAVIKSGDYQGLYVGAKSQVTLKGGTFRPYMDTMTNENVKSIFWKVNETTDATSRDCMELLGDGCVYVDENRTQVRTGGGFNTVVTVQQGTAIDAPVAKIGNVEYASLSKAIDAVQNGGTITLLDDLDLGNGAVLQVGSSQKNFTIDLDNHTLSADGACLIMLHNGSQLTLKNGTLDGSRCTSYEGVLYISSNSGPKLTLENVTAKSGTVPDTLNGQRSVLLAYVTYGTVEFDGGTYTGGVLLKTDGNAVLKSGTFRKGTNNYSIKTEDSGKHLSDYLDESLFWNGDTVLDLSSETQTADEVTVRPCEHNWENGKCTVCQKVCDHGSADGKSMTEDPCHTCGMKAAAQVDITGSDAKYFPSFTDALVYATKNNGCTLKLLADVTGTTVMINNPFLFDLNGHNVDALSVDARATIKDSGTTKGRIGKVTVSNEKVTDLTLGDLLEEGYAFKYETGYWADDSHKETISGLKVTVEKAPIQSVKIYAKDKNHKEVPTTMAYGTTGEVTLVSSCRMGETSGADLSYLWYKLEGAAATAPLEGATGANYTLPDNLAAGTHTYLLICTSGGYSKSAEITITVTPVSLEGAEVTVENPTYNGQKQFPAVTVKLDENTTLTKGTDFYVDATMQANAGSYTLTVNGNGNYSGKIENVEWKIEPMKIDSVMVSSAISKVYDGTAEINMSANEWATALKFKTLSASGVVDVPSEAYTISDAYFVKKSGEETIYSPDAGEKYGITFKITLNDDNYVLQTYGEDTPSTSKVITQSGGATFTIKQATVTSPGEITQLVFNDLAKTYTIDLAKLLPKLSEGCEYGDIQYQGCDYHFTDSTYLDSNNGMSVSEEGILTLPTVSAHTSDVNTQIGTITVPVVTTNYQNFEFTIKVYISARIPPNASGVTVSASDITYGQMLNESKLTATGTMKHPGTGEEVKGTFAWTNPEAKPGAAGDYTASWTFTPAAGYEEYAPATGTVTIKVNKATPTFTAPTAQENLTYTGQEQALITAGMTDHGTMLYSLTENGTYSQDIPTGTDAGAYTVWYRVIGDANHNDTAPASVAVSIGKKPLTITGVTVAPKPYDGTTNADISSVTFDNVTLNRGTDYTVTASFDDAGVGNGKNVTATVTLTEQTAKNYALEQSSFPTTGSITKAAAPDFTKETALTIVNGHEKTYTVTLPALPTLETPKAYGALTYEIGEIKLNDGYYTSGAKVENGELTLPIQKNDVETTGSVGTVTVVIKSINYKDITLTVNVNAVNQITPVPDGTITASEITYGDTLSKSTITGTMQDPNTRDAVNGTFTWLTPDEKLKAGSHNAKWIFTPDESNGGKYTTNTGTATVTVNPKAVTVSGITANDKVYDGTTNAGLDYSAVTLGGVLENDTLTVTATGTLESANVGEQNVTISDLTLGGDSVANYVLAESENQTETTATITAKKVTVTITPNGGTYGSVTAAAANLSGAVDGENVPVTLTYTGNGYNDTAVPVNAGSYTVTVSISNSNYTLTGNTTADFVITPKAVTVSGITANDKVYDGTTNAVLDYSNAQFDGILENDKLTVAAKGMFEKAEAGKQNVAISDLKLGGDSAANYVLAESGNQTETTATITAKEVTVTPDNKSKVYEEKDPKLTYIVSGVLSGETLKGITLARAEGENAGEYDITGTADAGANPNYDVTFAKGTFTIKPKSIQSATVVLGKGLAANGAEQTQTVEKVLLNNKELPADSYTVAGNTATDPGSRTLTITAKGNYTGTVDQTYVIVPAKAEDSPGEEIVIGSGKVKVNVKFEGTVPPATLLTNKAELLAMLVDSGDITADELAQIADGASVDIVLTVKEANVPDAVKTAMAQAAKDYTIGQYLDISLFKYMTVNGSQQAGVALHTTKNALTISVAVPDALINTNSAVNRTYCIVRNHEGTITVLDAAFDAASKTLTFKTDRFSDYAIAYKDTAVPSSGSNPGSNNSSNGSETKKNEVAAPTPAPTPASTSKPSTITAMPQTGDTSNPTLYVVLLVASLLGLAVVFVCKKRNDK